MESQEQVLINEAKREMQENQNRKFKDNVRSQLEAIVFSQQEIVRLQKAIVVAQKCIKEMTLNQVQVDV